MLRIRPLLWTIECIRVASIVGVEFKICVISTSPRRQVEQTNMKLYRKGQKGNSQNGINIGCASQVLTILAGV